MEQCAKKCEKSEIQGYFLMTHVSEGEKKYGPTVFFYRKRKFVVTFAIHDNLFILTEFLFSFIVFTTFC